eukprot:CAMPEP_0183410386 /NCGR_PEP_ID=MMETSP0370-20130417/19544_1 /TAXON_ID=268820 /ORGANISM="Peridinium aciculiferum, Strain PAER-2" /LENGTH=73 /DNA_ID=CAMNT_0025593223 /DNA_START=165 /DNA_END=382 /DNA_ORIENTATION=-
MSIAFANMQGVLDAVTKCFRAKITALGFSACEAEPSVFFGGHIWSLKASWPGVPEQEEAPQRTPSGASAECPV